VYTLGSGGGVGEHLCDFKNGYGKSRFVQHLLENRHAIGPMNDIMDTL